MQTAPIDLCDDDTHSNDTGGSIDHLRGPPVPSRKRPAPIAGNNGGWMRRRSRKANAPNDDHDSNNSSDAADTGAVERSPSSLTPPPSGIVAPQHSAPIVLEPTIDIRSPIYYEEEDNEDDRRRGKEKEDDGNADTTVAYDAIVSQIIETTEDAVTSVAVHPEPETPNVCALTAAHRLARLDGMAECLAEAAVEHRRHRAQQPGGQFSKTRRRRARIIKANDFVHERFRIAHALGKHYNELFHPRGRRFAGRPEASTASRGASTATRGHRARMALFWLDTLVRFDRTFNVAGDLPAPTVERPLSARDMLSLHKDSALVAASLADKFGPPDERAGHRERPPPRPTARVDFSGADDSMSARRQRRRAQPVDNDNDGDDGDRDIHGAVHPAHEIYTDDDLDDDADDINDDDDDDDGGDDDDNATCGSL
ncbi:hypothetical protein pqer_cds_540 [Pandoravirus quercus]|uniref:Uncharacterized protein n=1 Tax=Pandoravirus quercus TaxID=2107709 RepID=A0A2U7U994_9VIRU|nr:hypothetical protein pqer_cds_540 [Pandoravirus quercus]AVK74962.1 hypothetical protein pqer_cds_540 [Pandoravirus quercus]